MDTKRALISVSDKTGIIELAKFLQNINCEIISTGGTGKLLKENGIKITEIEKITGNPEAFGGRMKTISFNVESAILFDRIKDKEEAKKLKIKPIDLVVCNFYPFEKVYREGADLPDLVENIDIGGPTMIRAAAKNYKFVGILINPRDYVAFIEKYKDNKYDEDFRFDLMRKAFTHTAMYDLLISNAMNENFETDHILLAFDKKTKLRYGENSHQTAFYYREKYTNNSLYDFNKLQGKEISFNNLLDINSAIESVSEFDKPACSIIKHNNPCGLSVSEDVQTAFELAWQGDSVSAFGSIVAFNSPVDFKTVSFLNLEDKKQKKFIEVIIAPEFTNEAIEYLKKNQNLRVIEFDSKKLKKKKDMRYLNGLLLVQDKDKKEYDKLRLVTETFWDYENDLNLIKFGIKAIKMIKSNAIVLVRKVQNSLQLLGMGAGQPNRIIATKLAVEKAIENLRMEYKGENPEEYIKSVFENTILVSDAFFPFDDSIKYVSLFGIKKIVQPGGSIRDKKVIKTANQLGIAMVFSGLRHFKH